MLTGAGTSTDVFINSNLNGTISLSTTAASVASLTNLPAGSYLLSAKVSIGFNSAAGAQDLCTLSVGGTPIDFSYATVSSAGGIFFETAKLLGAVTLSSSNSIIVTCATNNGTASAFYPVLTATKVSSITSM